MRYIALLVLQLVLLDKPALINISAEESAWLFQLQLSKVEDLDSLIPEIFTKCDR